MKSRGGNTLPASDSASGDDGPAILGMMVRVGIFTTEEPTCLAGNSNFGHPMSHGFFDLPTPGAEGLFYWADVGTLVNVHR